MKRGSGVWHSGSKVGKKLFLHYKCIDVKKIKGKRGIVENNETQFELSENSSAAFNSKQLELCFQQILDHDMTFLMVKNSGSMLVLMVCSFFSFLKVL